MAPTVGRPPAAVPLGGVEEVQRPASGPGARTCEPTPVGKDPSASAHWCADAPGGGDAGPIEEATRALTAGDAAHCVAKPSCCTLKKAMISFSATASPTMLAASWKAVSAG